MCAVLSGLLAFQEIGEVNRKLPADEQIGYYGFYPGKMQKVARAYKSLYPCGRVDTVRLLLGAGAILFTILALVASRGGWRGH